MADIKEKDENSIPLLDIEAQKLAAAEDEPYTPPPAAPALKTTAKTRRNFLIWTAINMLATIGIVFTNKAIFNDPAFKLMQTSFAGFHFVCTGLTLWVVSRKSIGAFVPKRARIVEMLPVWSAPLMDVRLLTSRLVGFCYVSECSASEFESGIFYGHGLPVCLGNFIFHLKARALSHGEHETTMRRQESLTQTSIFCHAIFTFSQFHITNLLSDCAECSSLP